MSKTHLIFVQIFVKEKKSKLQNFENSIHLKQKSRPEQPLKLGSPSHLHSDRFEPTKQATRETFYRHERRTKGSNRTRGHWDIETRNQKEYPLLTVGKTATPTTPVFHARP